MSISTSWQKIAIRLSLIWLGAIFLTSTYQVYPNREAYYHRVFNPKRHFIESAMDTCIDDPWDYQPVASLCAKAKWREGLTFLCGPPQGGVGNLRNVVVNCIRYAIEGGGDLVLPQIFKRDENLVKLANGDRFSGDLRDFGYIFDLEHAIESMKLACPQMTVFGTIDELRDPAGHPSSENIQYIEPQQFGGGQVDGYNIKEPENWRNTFETWLNTTVPYTSSEEWRAWVDINTPFLQWPLEYERNVSNSLGRAVRFPANTRRLAATVYYELCQKFGFDIDPESPGIPENTFFGAHLRTAIDAATAGFTPYDNQVSLYLQQASAANLSVIYTSSDNPADVARFAAQAWESHKINVTSKNDLLQGADLTASKALAWDQQALVDYDVLLKASQFGGIYDSSFSANIAMRRHVLSGVEDPVRRGGQTWSDEFSWVYGPTDPITRIFFESLWP